MQIQMKMYLRFFNGDMIEVKIKLIKDVINVDTPSASTISPLDLRLHFCVSQNLIQKNDPLIKRACMLVCKTYGYTSQHNSKKEITHKTQLIYFILFCTWRMHQCMRKGHFSPIFNVIILLCKDILLPFFPFKRKVV